MPARQKRSKKKVIILLGIIFFHILSIIVSAFYDRGIQITKHGNSVKFNEVRYWLWFFTWWSAWVSLLTVPWAFYKLFTRRKNSSYGEQWGDIVITEANLISGIIFCGGGFLLTYPHHPQTLIPFPLLGEVKIIYIYIFYNLFWHVLAPALVFYYFWKYCQVNKLNKKPVLLANLIPTIYLIYVILRPLMTSYYPKGGSNKTYTYPRDYPYNFFFWSAGKVANRKEENSNSKLYFWHKWPPWLKILFWNLVIFVVCYMVFSALFRFLVKIKLKRNNKLAINNRKW